MKTLRQWIEETCEVSEGNVIQDLDVLHEEEDFDYATMCEVSMKMFEPEGLKKFEKVLNAEVVNARAEGRDYYVVLVRGVKVSALKEFEWAQSGYCSVDEYNKWFVDKV